ncbi:TetR/AcrR family transcriptional regulator [Actinacidiphila acididurans]|uniref:TetR/AcrR family transcriptional regulator n=1 Tax=Actinacidiphila acididurans TaxID=2784346 RepID=A0ABS2TLT0_9ACTN|nr:TetR/AcrR family transcriptional regulator [Actinacidiphila acididurans]MBM9504294.1 TetR/AcrR family transcriptional regulator [Actinacidiphila acididurans]
MVDPRIVRTERAVEEAVLALAATRPVSRISVSELAAAAGVSRATFYNRYATVLDALTRALRRDLRVGWEADVRRRAAGACAQDALRLANAAVVDHVERFRAVYAGAPEDDAGDHGVFEALTEHFIEYALDFMRTSGHAPPDGIDRRIVARFLAHGLAGALRAWLRDGGPGRDDLVEALSCVAPPWWTGRPGPR